MNLNLLFILVISFLAPHAYSQGWVQEQIDTTSDKIHNFGYGDVVDINNNVAIAGAHRHWIVTDIDSVVWAGAAYIFGLDEDDGEWIEMAQLTAFDASFADFFGTDVAIEEDVAVVTAIRDDTDSTDSGSCYIYELIDEEWELITKIIPDDELASGHYGSSCAINNGRIVIGAAGMSHAFIYEKIDGIWTETFVLSHDEGFGSSIDLHNNRLIVGGAGWYSGVIVYDFIDGDWIEMVNLKDLTPGTDPNYGRSISVWGDFVAVGSPKYVGPSVFDKGVALIYKKIAEEWFVVDTLFSIDDGTWSKFGQEVDIDSNKMIVSSPRYDSGTGAIETFELNEAGEWIFEAHVQAESEAENHYFGTAAGISNNWIFSGAPNAAEGRTYFFSRCERLDVTVSDHEICYGESVILDATSATEGTIMWTESVENSVAFVPDTVGLTTYYASSSSELDCAFSTYVIMRDSLSVSYVYSDLFDDGDWFIELTVLGGVPPYRYDWDTDELDDFDDPKDILVFPGVYNVVVKDTIDCIIEETVDILYLGNEEILNKRFSSIYLPESERMNFSNLEPIVLTIYNATGSRVYQCKIESNGQIDLSQLNLGVYIIIGQSENGNRVFNEKLLKY